MTAARPAAEQLHQIKTLANDALVGIKTMIGNHDQRGVGSHLTVLNSGPQAAEQRVDRLQRRQMRFAIVIVMRRVVEIHRQQIEIANPLVAETGNQLALQLVEYDVSSIETGHKFRCQINWVAPNELRLGRKLDRLDAGAAAIELRSQ